MKIIYFPAQGYEYEDLFSAFQAPEYDWRGDRILKGQD